MRRSIVLVLIAAGCPGLPDETDTDPDTRIDTDTDTDTLQPPCPEDLHEDNDTQEMAAPLDPTVPLTGQICADDPDWFAVPLTGACTARLDLDFTHADGDLDLEVWDGERRVAASSTTTDGEQVRFYVGDEDTTFQVLVEGFGGAENGYVLTTDLDCPTCVVEDTHEDNDTFATAIPVPFPLTADACAGDDDWYALPLTAPGCAVDVALAVVDGDVADVTLDLADEAGVLARATRVGTGLEVRSLASAEAAIAVVGTAATRYDLALSEVCPDPAPACPADDGWANGTGEPAIVVPAGMTASAIACPAAPDAWVIQSFGCERELTVTSDDPVAVRVLGTQGTLYDSEGTTHAWSSPPSDGAAYTIEVTRPADATTDPTYTITATAGSCPTR